jgi:hypothetical protein
MIPTIEAVRRRLHHYGWSMVHAAFVTLDGGKLWVVSGRRGKQFFSAQGGTEREAWQAAWRLAQQLRLLRRLPVQPAARSAQAAPMALQFGLLSQSRAA